MIRWLPRLLALTLLSTAATGPALALEIWSGRTYGFTKPPFANPTLPGSQDRITDQVWITRGNSMGIFNIRQESSYLPDFSPKDTEWATGNAVDHASLTFQPWELWHGSSPPSMIGVNAVVHLVSEDIYVDIVFDSWGSAITGGAFSYRRALPPVVPAKPTSWGRIKGIYRR